MRIKNLHIREYQVIREVQLENLSDFVVIAGANGVGKTKIKDAICHIFQNNGNPPSNCAVTLEATNSEEETGWGAKEVSLPNTAFGNLFQKRRKKINTSATLIHIDSGRQIEQINFRQKNFSDVSSIPDLEVDNQYSTRRVKDRFSDIGDTLLELKQRLLLNLGREAHAQLEANATSSGAVVQRQEDPTKKFEDLFGQLLHPKRMSPIQPDSSTIQYFDEDGILRSFSELSSGEREVIVLSFDILLQNPTDSVIVIDEPEIHLHPELAFRLVKVLKSIGERNQIFLFTHSPDIIGSAFETGIYFVRPKSRTTGNQAVKVDSSNLDDLKLIPNLRETIGMLSLGKKLLFVEGSGTSMDRSVFSSIAKSTKIDIAIVPSDSCSNINNMALMCETLQKGLFGIELYMVRDRDSLLDSQIASFTAKSAGKLRFLPFYHIENTFLSPEAIHKIALKLNPTTTLTVQDIGNKLVEFARDQINSNIVEYVRNEIRFQAGNFDATPVSKVLPSTTVEEIIQRMVSKKDSVISEYASDFSEINIRAKVEGWKTKLENSLASGWSSEARVLFYGKGLLPRIAQYISPGKTIDLADEIIRDDSSECKNAIKPLADILASI